MNVRILDFTSPANYFYRINPETIPLTMDQMELLFKYMAHLYKIEQSTFLELINTPFSYDIYFSKEEINILQEMSRRIEEADDADKYISQN